MYEWLSQDLSLDSADGPKDFSDPYSDVKLIESAAGKGWIVMIWENRVRLNRGCSRSGASSCGTEGLADNSGRGLVIYECSLAWSCQVHQFSGSRKCRSGKGPVGFILFSDRGKWRSRKS